MHQEISLADFITFVRTQGHGDFSQYDITLPQSLEERDALKKELENISLAGCQLNFKITNKLLLGLDYKNFSGAKIRQNPMVMPSYQR